MEMGGVLGFRVETGVISGIRREVLFEGDVLLHFDMGMWERGIDWSVR